MVDNVARFKANSIVKWMLDVLESEGTDLNRIKGAFNRTRDKDDYQQLMQLIGYSVDGYCDLSCRDNTVMAVATGDANTLWEEKKAKRHKCNQAKRRSRRK